MTSASRESTFSPQSEPAESSLDLTPQVHTPFPELTETTFHLPDQHTPLSSDVPSALITAAPSIAASLASHYYRSTPEFMGTSISDELRDSIANTIKRSLLPYNDGTNSSEASSQPKLGTLLTRVHGVMDPSLGSLAFEVSYEVDKGARKEYEGSFPKGHTFLAFHDRGKWNCVRS